HFASLVRSHRFRRGKGSPHRTVPVDAVSPTVAAVGHGNPAATAPISTLKPMNNGSRHTLVIGEGVPEPRSSWSGVHAGSSIRWYHLGERRRLLVFTLTGTAYFTCKNRDGLCRSMSLGSLELH